MDADQPQNFNDRLSQWIASQGFWFQLRYSMSSGGGWSVALFHLLRMTVRVLILLLVVGLGFAFYLSKRVNSAAFTEGLSDRFAMAMDASEAEIVGFSRAQGVGKIRRFGAEGTSKSFFQTLEAGNLSFKMGYLDGLYSDWNAGIIDGNWIDVHVKAGANSSDEAKAAAETLFKRRPNFEVLGLSFTKARVTWGYDDADLGVSEGRSRIGEIEGSTLSANRVSEGWRFNFKGGTFTQNWIRGFEIEEMVMLCTPTELIVEKGLLRVDDGHVTLKDVKVEGGALPEITGRLVMKNVPLDRLMPEKISERISGSVSAELDFSGSTNSTEGIVLDGPVTLSERDVIQVRNEFPILEALDVVDDFNSYKRVVFDQGSFNLRTGGGEMLISDLTLEARDLMGLQGRISARYPTSEEVARTIGGNASDLLMPLVGESEDGAKVKDITLKRAAAARKKEEEEGEGEATSEKSEFFAGLASKRDEKTLRRAAAQRALSTLIFEGSLRMSIPGDAFERSRILSERHPVDQTSGRVNFDVPLRGTLPELTLSQAEVLLRDGGKDL